jgi:hypothetical protein
MRASVDTLPDWVIEVPDGWLPYAPTDFAGALWVRGGRTHPSSVTVSVEPAGTGFDVQAFVETVLAGTVLSSSVESPGAWYCLVSSASPNGPTMIEQQAWEIEGSLVVITATCLAGEFAELRNELAQMLAEPEAVGELVEARS